VKPFYLDTSSVDPEKTNNPMSDFRFSGDDLITREPGMVPGTASRLANDEMLAVRAFLNAGGRLLYTGK
jgi:hypothetical protein